MKSRFLLLFFIASFYVNAQFNYDIDWKKESIILGGSSLMVGGSLLIDNARKPLSLDGILTSTPTVNSFDRFALENNSMQARAASDVLFYFSSAVPMLVLASEHLRGKEIEYLLMFGETIALNAGLTFLVKSATDRKRPYFYNPTFPIDERQSLDARKAFYSGHASHTAALSFFTARVFSDLYPDSRWKYVVWSGAVILPATTAVLRVQAGRHFPTDVIVGYGVGAGIGLLIPYIHRSKLNQNSAWKISPTLNGIAVTFKL